MIFLSTCGNCGKSLSQLGKAPDPKDRDPGPSANVCRSVAHSFAESLELGLLHVLFTAKTPAGRLAHWDDLGVTIQGPRDY